MKLLLLTMACVAFCAGKIYTPEELAVDLLANGIPEDQIDTWLCIIEWESSFNTSAHNLASGDHGLFQINQKWWCSPPGESCGMTCDSLRDEDISNDVQCSLIIYDEHVGISGNGFDAWHGYTQHCKDIVPKK